MILLILFIQRIKRIDNRRRYSDIGGKNSILNESLFFFYILQWNPNETHSTNECCTFFLSSVVNSLHSSQTLNNANTDFFFVFSLLFSSSSSSLIRCVCFLFGLKQKLSFVCLQICLLEKKKMYFSKDKITCRVSHSLWLKEFVYVFG